MAINPRLHGREKDTDLDLCDVCYWRKRAEMNWLPISQAPKDDTIIDIYSPSYDRITDCKMYVCEGIEFYSKPNPDGQGATSPLIYDATHFMFRHGNPVVE